MAPCASGLQKIRNYGRGLKMLGLGLIIAALLAALVVLPRKAEALTRTIIDPDSIDGLIAENAKRYSIDPALIRAFIQVESSFNPNAVNPVSSTNRAISYGLMQITPALAEDFGVVRDYHNPTEAEIAMIMLPSRNVQIGTWQISRLLSDYPFDQAVQMYNVGIAGYKNGARNSDYLAKITRWYNEYKPH